MHHAHPDRIRIVFESPPGGHRSNLGLGELVDHHLDLGRAGAGQHRQADDRWQPWPGRLHRRRRCVAHRGDGLHPGRHGLHPGHLPAQLPVGPVRQLDRVSRELLARAWAAGAGPGDAPFTIDLDSTICETYGLAKEGARHHGYTGKRGYQLLAIAAGTGDVLMSRLREGRANTARGAAHPAGDGGTGAAPGPTDDSRYGPTAAFYTPVAWYPSAARWMSASPSPSASRACRSSRRYPRMPGHPIPYWRTATPMWPRPPGLPSRVNLSRRSSGAEAHARFPAGPLRHLQHHGFITDRDGEMLELEADHRRHAEIENAIRASSTP